MLPCISPEDFSKELWWIIPFICYIRKLTLFFYFIIKEVDLSQCDFNPKPMIYIKRYVLSLFYNMSHTDEKLCQYNHWFSVSLACTKCSLLHQDSSQKCTHDYPCLKIILFQCIECDFNHIRFILFYTLIVITNNGKMSFQCSKSDFSESCCKNQNDSNIQYTYVKKIVVYWPQQFRHIPF